VLICAPTEAYLDEFYGEVKNSAKRGSPQCKELVHRINLVWFTALFIAFIRERRSEEPEKMRSDIQLIHISIDDGSTRLWPIGTGRNRPYRLRFTDPINTRTFMVAQEAVKVSLRRGDDTVSLSLQASPPPFSDPSTSL